jgi:hypothetical protein
MITKQQEKRTCEFIGLKGEGDEEKKERGRRWEGR